MLTPYQIERQKNEDFDDLSQLRTTTKRTEEGRIFQNKCVSSQQIFLRERALP